MNSPTGVLSESQVGAFEQEQSGDEPLRLHTFKNVCSLFLSLVDRINELGILNNSNSYNLHDQGNLISSVETILQRVLDFNSRIFGYKNFESINNVWTEEEFHKMLKKMHSGMLLFIDQYNEDEIGTTDSQLQNDFLFFDRCIELLKAYDELIANQTSDYNTQMELKLKVTNDKTTAVLDLVQEAQ